MPAPSLKVFPDQGAKLRYLIRIRGDRRPVVESLAKSRAGKFTRDEHAQLKPLIRKQEQLATAFNLDKSRISDWVRDKARIPDNYLTAICRIFAVGETAFRTWSFEEFAIGCKAENFQIKPNLSERSASRWRGLLRERNSGGVRLLFSDPHGDHFAPTAKANLRYAWATSAADGPLLPEVPVETPFWLALASPQREDGATAWAGWQLLLLSHDRRLNGFANPLAPHAGPDRSAIVPFPDARTLYLPHRTDFRHPSSDHGEFALIAVLSREPFPERIVLPFSVATASGPELEPALHELATWIAEHAEAEATAIASQEYRVVREPGAGDR